MRIKTAEWVTATLPVDIVYRCSSCGKENLAKEVIKGVAKNGPKAQQSLEAILKQLVEGTHPSRFRSVNFNCCCRFCRHTEPWSQMNNIKLDSKLPVCTSVMIISLIVALSFAISGEYNEIFYGMIAIFVASIIWFLSLGKKNRNFLAQREKQIATLPKQSLPVIMLHSPERHKAFNQATGTSLYVR